MAYTGFAGSYQAPQTEQTGRFRRWVAALLATRSPAADDAVAKPAPRKLAGPDPLDLRVRGYMADLDMEAGF